VRDEHEVELSAYHEAAHAVFAHYDGIDVDNVCVSDERGNCDIYRADLYERYRPMRYAQFYLAGAYAAGVAADLEHPTPDEVPLSWLIAGAERTPEGDAWYALEALKRVVKEGDVFDSVGEAYAFAMIKLAGLVEKRWYEIEALAFALHDRWVESEEGIGRVDGMNCPKSSSAYKERMSMPNTNGHGPKRAILYARVSTDEQARSGYSLPRTIR
jgi:hypothetical protein